MTDGAGPRRIAVVALFGLQACAAAPLTFFRLFAGFKKYDDEGMFMLWDRHFFAGHALYDEVWSFYGPLPHLIRYLLHQLGALPLSHDAYRMLTLLLWLGAASLLSYAVLRLTRSLSLAALAHLLLLLHLSPIRNEPVHPQEYVALLLGAVVVLASSVRPGGRLAVAGLGAAAAAMLLTKMNAGALLLLALGSSLALAARSGRRIQVLRALSVLCLVALAPALLGRDVGSAGWRGLALGAALGALLLWESAREGERERPLGLPEVGWFAAATVAGLGLGVLVPVLLGSSPGKLVWSVFALPVRITAWVGADPWMWLPPPILALAGAAAYLVHRWRRGEGRPGAAAGRRLAAARVLLGLGLVGLAPGLHGDSSYGVQLVALPVLWLLLIPASDLEARFSHWFPRLVLALSAALESFYVYPVTGSQAAFGTLLVPVCGLVGLGDGARELARLPAVALRRRAWERAGAGLLALALVAAYSGLGLLAARAWRAETPLGLPGARWVRAHPGQAAALRWLALNVSEHCDSFLAIPGFNSLYFWTRKEAPGPASADRWFLFFEPGQRRALLDALLAQPRPCFLRDGRSTDAWLEKTRDPDPVRALLREVDRAFEPLGQAADWRLLIARGRPAPALTWSAWILPQGGSWVLAVSLPPALDAQIARVSIRHIGQPAPLADTDPSRGPRAPLHFEGDPAPAAAGEPAAPVLRRSSPLPGRLLLSLDGGGLVVELYDREDRLLGSVPILREPAAPRAAARPDAATRESGAAPPGATPPRRPGSWRRAGSRPGAARPPRAWGRTWPRRRRASSDRIRRASPRSPPASRAPRSDRCSRR